MKNKNQKRLNKKEQYLAEYELEHEAYKGNDAEQDRDESSIFRRSAGWRLAFGLLCAGITHYFDLGGLEIAQYLGVTTPMLVVVAFIIGAAIDKFWFLILLGGVFYWSFSSGMTSPSGQ